MKLSSKMIISFIIAILISILIISFFANFMINREFENYLIAEQDAKMNKVYEDLNDMYISNGNSLPEDEFKAYVNSIDLDLTFEDKHRGTTYHCHNLNTHRKNKHERPNRASGHKNNRRNIKTKNTRYKKRSWSLCNTSISKTSICFR